jgi:aspartate/methionine/tyrosine aminotransferase
MVEVCSTTLPQKALPHILSHPQYPVYLEQRRQRYERFSQIAYDRLNSIPGVIVNPTNGAFYMSVAFEDGVLNHHQTLPVSNGAVSELVKELTEGPNIQPDKRFVYYLLAATGICVVPLTSFNTHMQGFRLTLLEVDETRFCKMLDKLKEGIERYTA